MARILGILNITQDSFSDGGRFLDPRAAIEHGRRLAADGADYIDIGAESSHPDAADVPEAVEIARLRPVVAALKGDGSRISVDTCKPAVMTSMAALGVDVINDITGFRDPRAVDAVRRSSAKLIIMHSRASAARAERHEADPRTIVAEIGAFFRTRIAALTGAGIDPSRLILDPGMGFFLGANAETSLVVLRELRKVVALGFPVCVSVSRKSFIGAVLEVGGEVRPVAERGAGTLAAEIFAVRQGAAFIRTHDVRALRDALTVTAALDSGLA